ncbi:MAG: EAL domain-containing protein, partial [Aeromonas hydrophila]
MAFPRTLPRLAHWRWLVVLLAGGLPLLAGTYLVMQDLQQQRNRQTQTAARQALLRIEQLLAKAERTSGPVTALVGQPCQTALPALRQHATQAAFVRTFQLVQRNAVYCASLLGDVQQPVPKKTLFVGKIALLPGTSWQPDHPVLALRTPVGTGAVIAHIDSAHLTWVLTTAMADGQHIGLRVGSQWLDEIGRRYRSQSAPPLAAIANLASRRYPFSIVVGYPVPPQAWPFWLTARGPALLGLLVGSLGWAAGLGWWLGRPTSPNAALRRAIQAREFIPYVQPVVDARTRQLCGVEVLMRWQHPHAGLVEPACFISQAERSGLIVPMTSQMMAQLIPALVSVQAQLPSPFHVAVNVSAAHFDSMALLENCTALLAQFAPGKVVLTLELTEREWLRDDPHTLTLFSRLRAMGVLFALDDFGTGHANLAYLKQFPIDIIKLDHGFVRKLGVDTLSRHLADHVIKLGMTLGLVVIAEGVETPDQADYLTAKGVNQLQGYLFGQPQPLATWVATL